jgi:hypothetical protein
MARVNEAGDRTPTTQEHWERYADELLVKLERAEARVKELETANEILGADVVQQLERVTLAEARVKELEAENKRLREELKGIILWTGWKIWPRASPSPERVLGGEEER